MDIHYVAHKAEDEKGAGASLVFACGKTDHIGISCLFYKKPAQFANNYNVHEGDAHHLFTYSETQTRCRECLSAIIDSKSELDLVEFRDLPENWFDEPDKPDYEPELADRYADEYFRRRDS